MDRDRLIGALREVRAKANAVEFQARKTVSHARDQHVVDGDVKRSLSLIWRKFRELRAALEALGDEEAR